VFSLFDTKLRAVTTIQPARAGQLRIYSCGPDVHGPARLSDLKPFLLGDLIRRNGERHGLSVVACQAVPDIRRPAGEDTVQAGEEAFLADCAVLNIAPPDYLIRASESVGLAIDLIGRLIEAGHAYAEGGSVYFDVRSFPGYGDISGNRASPDGGRPLWHGAQQDEEPAFDAPWGSGFPVWAAVCSAVSAKYLGKVIDLHAGGVDLLFPHHEDERACCDSAAGREVFSHWVHAERLLFEDGEPTVADLAGRGLDPLAARLALLRDSYREKQDLTWEGLGAADAELRHMRELVADWANEPSKPMCAEYWASISGALDDDLDTPSALSALRDLAADREPPAGSKFETFAAADRVLALDLVRLVGRPAASRPG
jgi:cysteinyl-tRNA synthetase